jgi:hypothetical protein
MVMVRVAIEVKIDVAASSHIISPSSCLSLQIALTDLGLSM